MSDKRLEALETALAYQEQQIQDLNDSVQAQWKAIDLLKAKLQQAEGKIELFKDELAEDGNTLSASEAAARDKPPHY